jgi:hypothetical protein
VALEGLLVERRQIMRWPAHSLEGLDAVTVSKRSAVPRIVHWGGLKKARQRNMQGADLLAFFEKVYYGRLPAGGARRIFAGYQNAFSYWANGLQERAGLAWRRLSTGEHN